MTGADLARRRVALALLGDIGTAADAAIERLARLEADGACLPHRPTDAAALVRSLSAGPPETLKLIDYMTFLSSLPADAQAAVRARWGAPERDPAYVPGELDCGGFHFPILRIGAVAIGPEPTRGSPSEPPRHAVLAFYGWIRESFRADLALLVGQDHADVWRRLALGPLARTEESGG